MVGMIQEKGTRRMETDLVQKKGSFSSASQDGFARVGARLPLLKLQDDHRYVVRRSSMMRFVREQFSHLCRVVVSLIGVDLFGYSVARHDVPKAISCKHYEGDIIV